MADSETSGAPASSHRLYSETPYDERGNFHYVGDLYQPSETLGVIAERITRHLAAHFPDAKLAVRTERFAGGRKVTAEILDMADDLSGREAANSVIVAIRDQMERFGATDANPLQDYFSTSFYAEVKIGGAYWAALAARRGPRNPVEAKLSLGSFRKRLRVGDAMRLVDAPAGHRALGTTRTVTAVRSKDLIFEGRSYLDFPRASAFACDGRLVRIAIGRDQDPDAHLLYEWLPQGT